MKKFIFALAASCGVVAGAAHAVDVGPVLDPDKWFVHLGATGVLFDSGLVKANIPTVLNTQVTNNITGSVEIGHYLTDQFSLSLSAGIPPTNDINTTTPLGTAKSGTSTYGALILDAQYHFDMGQVKPYLGAGIAYNHTFSTTAVVGSPIKIDDSIGAVLQVGAEAPVSDHVGIFVDVKKMFTTVHVTKGALAEDVRLNPWIISAGVSIHF